jgi:PPOX class probable F420-dependent enzyme
VDRAELITFVRERGLAVVCTCGPDGAPQAALVGVAATDRAELVFDTTNDSRKVANIRRDPRVAVVIGWDDEVTVQSEGVADILEGPELDRCRSFYVQQYPDGQDRASWPGITYVRIRPRWVRYCDFRPGSPHITETSF